MGNPRIEILGPGIFLLRHENATLQPFFSGMEWVGN